MTMIPRNRTRLGAILAVGVGFLSLAGSALGVGEPTGVAVTPPSPSKGTTLTFTWGAPETPPGLTFTDTYVGGLVPDGSPSPGAEIASGVVYGEDQAVAEGRYDFHVGAVYTDALAQPVVLSTTVQDIIVDRTPPTLSLSLSPSTPTGLGGYHTSALNIVRTCNDGALGSQVANCGPIPWSDDRPLSPLGLTVTDAAGNTSATATVSFGLDTTKPLINSGLPVTPAPGALVASEPGLCTPSGPANQNCFSWTPGADATSDVARYELQFRISQAGEETDYETVATVAHTGGVGNYSAASSVALPEKKNLAWRVVTYDKAGNNRASDPRGLRIDSTIPPAPTITGGPAAPTRISSPTFSWTGSEDSFLWDLTVVGSETPVRRNGGPATQVTITNLPDGDYTFRVSQVTDAGRPSAEATRSFKVDTTPPPPPGILVRPPFPAIAAPVFTWEAEPGAYSRWTVLGEGGVTVIPATDTPTTTANLPLLPDGAYSFQVRQIDAAGNVSAATAEPFTMLAPLAPAPSPSLGGGGSVASVLPRQNAVRLKPKAGRTLPTRAPVLQWKRGPRGTKLYNLQIFRVTSRRGAATPKITKVLSLFPRGLQLRAPKRNLKPNTCYVWRVWPYTGRAFTPKPVGVSNFCVANNTVLKKKAAAARAKKLKIARARKAAAQRPALRR